MAEAREKQADFTPFEMEPITFSDDSERSAFLRMVVDYEAADENGEYPGFFSDPFCRKDFSSANLKKFMPRLCIALLFNTLCLYVNNVSQAWLQSNISGYYETRWPGNQTYWIGHTKHTPNSNFSSVVLWDVVFETLPHLSSTKPADTMAAVIPVCWILRFIIVPGPLSLRWTIFNRVYTIWGFLWLFRAFTIWATPLPNPDPTCIPRISYPNNVFWEGWANLPFMKWKYDELTCQDVMYSGHTMAMTLPMLACMKYLPLAPWSESESSRSWNSISTVFNLVGTSILLVCYYLIIGSHFHYTVDVLVGCVVSAGAFVAYHHQVKVSYMRSNRERLGLTNFLRWFEIHSRDLITWRRKARRNMESFCRDGQLI